MRPAVLHGFGTSAKQRLPTQLAELAQFGWLPLAAALFGTVDWQPQWLHHNFLPVIGLRVHAKIPPSPLSYQQVVSLLGLWERRAILGSQCRALAQAAELKFGLPTAFTTPEDWQTKIKEDVYDVVQCAQRIYTGDAASESGVSLERPQKWAKWVFSLEKVWQDDAPMPERPLTVHCSGLGGGLLSPDHEYDIFFQNHAQTKVYGPSLAMTDDWEQRITQLGLTKTTHEYAVYQLLSTALGWSVWKAFLPGRFADHKLLITRAIRLLTAATIRPAHARPPHPTWVTAVRQILRCYHPQGKRLFLRACFPQYMTVPVPEGMREVDILGFSAGSYTGLAIHEVLNEFACFPGTTKVAAIASPPEMLRLTTGERRVILLHCIEDQLCVWRPDSLTDLSYNIVLIEGHPAWSGRSRHAYGHLLFTTIADGTYHIDHLQITTPQVIPHGVRCEGLLRVLSWVSFDLPDHCKRTLSALLQAAGEGCSDLRTVPCEGRDVRDDPLVTEHDLRQVLIDMIWAGTCGRGTSDANPAD